MPMHRELNQDFFKHWSSEMAYVLGFFAADGSMVKNARSAHFIEFTITDRIVLEQIQKVTGSTHLIAERKKKAGHKAAYRLQIGSKKWFEDLSRLGFMQNKSKELPLPIVPEKCFGDFVRGYFDGDGCVYYGRLKFADRKKPRRILMTLFTSGCRHFLNELWDRLKTQGVCGGSLKEKNRGFELAFSHRDSIALHRIMYNTENIPDLWLPRKRSKLEKAIRELRVRE